MEIIRNFNSEYLLKIITKVRNKLRCKELDGIKHQIWWRGHWTSTWRLVPSVYREGRDHDYERHVAVRFKRQAPARYSQCPTSNIDWLFLMQHYRLPTRLLDWTESPLIALFFAVSEFFAIPENDSKPAALWAMNPFLLNQSQIEGMRVPTSPTHPIVKSMAREAFEVNPGNGEYKDKIIAVYPPHRDIRMLIQQAAATLHGTIKPIEELENNERFLVKIEIPPKQRQSLRAILNTLNIKLSIIFPDLEHLAQDIAFSTDGDNA
ncbi:MAG: hypothetical protein QG641_846 [Candidatus Poribacteria bacterium]|nr:hypothetical protein [Candidatus Poribacteria bacterium]MDQ1327563.1 hypothetical protein [Candidatus Poribacteria bacterium]